MPKTCQVFEVQFPPALSPGGQGPQGFVVYRCLHMSTGCSSRVQPDVGAVKLPGFHKKAPDEAICAMFLIFGARLCSSQHLKHARSSQQSRDQAVCKPAKPAALVQVLREKRQRLYKTQPCANYAVEPQQQR